MERAPARAPHTDVPGLEPRIVFEDELLLVLEKPAGLPCLPGAGIPVSVLDWVKRERPQLLALPGPRIDSVSEGGLLHRLDNETSGLLAFAKTPTELARLRGIWSTGKIRKLYTARCQPEAAAPALAALKDMRIETPIGHSAKSTKRMIVLEAARPMLLRQIRGEPQEAHTRIVEAREVAEHLRELRVEISTGVRHQIRAHLASIGHPIVGDDLYGGPPDERLFLHATELEVPRKRGESLNLSLPPAWSSPER